MRENLTSDAYRVMLRTMGTSLTLRRSVAVGVLGTSTLLVAYACGPAADTAPIVSSGHTQTGGMTASSGTGGATGDGSVVTVSGVATLVSGVFSPQSLALGPDNVYWTTSKALSTAGSAGDASAGPGSIETVLRTGGGAEEVVDGLTNPGSLAVVGNTLFWSASGSGGLGALLAYTIGTTTVEQVATGQTLPFPMAAGINTVFWATGSTSLFAVESVTSESPTSANVTRIAESMTGYQPVAMVVLSQNAYVLATSGGSAYVLAAHSSGGGGVSVLWHQASVTPVDLTGDGAALYWTLGNTPANGGQVLGTGIEGGSLITLATAQASPAKLTVSGGTVYYTSNVADGAVLSVSTGGGQISTLATGLDYPLPIAVDDAVYVGTTTSIVRVPK